MQVPTIKIDKGVKWYVLRNNKWSVQTKKQSTL